MGKVFDCISLSVIAFLLTFVWAALAFDSALPALIMACTLSLIAGVTLGYARKKLNKPYGSDRLALEFGLRGNEYIISLLCGVLKNPDIPCGRNYILLESGIVVANFKFSQLGIADIGAACMLARKYDKPQVFLICRGIDRKTYSIAALEGVRLTIVRIKTVFKLLKKHDALPDLKPAKQKATLKGVVSTIFARRNFKSYAFSGVLLILVSFITPLKIYYLAMGSAALALAAITLTPLGNGAFNSPKLSQEFEKAMTAERNQMSIDDIQSDV